MRDTSINDMQIPSTGPVDVIDCSGKLAMFVFHYNFSINIHNTIIGNEQKICGDKEIKLASLFRVLCDVKSVGLNVLNFTVK